MYGYVALYLCVASFYLFVGSAPFSELETQIVARVATSFQPTIFLSIHSGSLHMLAPYAYTNAMPGEPHGPLANDAEVGGIQKVLQVMNNVNRQFCHCTVGVAGKEVSLPYHITVERGNGKYAMCNVRHVAFPSQLVILDSVSYVLTLYDVWFVFPV